MKLTEQALRNIIKEELRRQRFEALYEDANLGNLLHQAVQHMWQADNMLGKALQDADESHYALVQDLKKEVEKVAFDIESKATKSERGEAPKAPPSRPSPSNKSLPVKH